MPNPQQLDAISITNEVQRRLGINTTADFAATKHARVLMQLLNEVIAEISDYGDWKEMYAEVSATAISGQAQYTLMPSTSGRAIQRIVEVSFDGQSAPLEEREPRYIRRLRRVSPSGAGGGNPRQFCLLNVNTSGNPVIEVFPRPGSDQDGNDFNVVIQEKERLLAETTADTTFQPVWPANLLIKGLYAKALLERSGGEQTREWQTAYAEFQASLRETYNRNTQDTGGDIFVYAGGRGYRV